MNEMLATPVAQADRVRGFVDVLRTSEHWPSVEPQSGDGYFPDRRSLPLPEGPIAVEIAQVQPGATGRTRLSGDEFVLVLEGDITFEQSGARCALGAGEAGVMVREHPLDWRTDGGAKLIVMRCTGGGAAGAEGPVRIDQTAPLTPSNPPAADVLIGPTPQCRNHTDYRSGSGEFVCGTWDSTPYHRQLITFRHYELMRLLEGSVTFVDAAGRAGTFGVGDVVLFEQGGGAAWESREPVKKIYSTYRPAQ
jgi:uncharacterized cupin superfamily protein